MIKADDGSKYLKVKIIDESIYVKLEEMKRDFYIKYHKEPTKLYIDTRTYMGIWHFCKFSLNFYKLDEPMEIAKFLGLKLKLLVGDKEQMYVQ